ncbi:MAG: hypothetical protein JWM80_1455, partial [Cyanobacteria bacterium RYN_339]|nr:hypothetical protein [Cyanobacteria bacterium RYN_339]
MTQGRHAVTTNLAGRWLRQPITADIFLQIGKARDRLLACL